MNLRPRTCALLVAAILATMFVVSGVGQHRAPTQAADGGSDRDDDAAIVADAISHGRWPYDQRTYLGNPLTHLPGAGILAIPFETLGGIEYQTPVWLAVMSIVVVRRRGSHLALILLASLATVPAVWHEIVIGGDLIANSIYVTLAASLVILLARRLTLATLGASFVLGLTLSSRPNFWLIGLFAIVVVWRQFGIRPAVTTGVTAAAALAAATLPWWLYDPQGFTPFHIGHKIDVLGVSQPVSVIVTTMAAAIAVGAVIVITRTDRTMTAAAISQVAFFAIPGITALIFGLQHDSPVAYLTAAIGPTALALCDKISMSSEWSRTQTGGA